MKIRIESDGTCRHTRVVDTETGQPIEGITRIEWTMLASDAVARARLYFNKVPVTIVTELSDVVGTRELADGETLKEAPWTCPPLTDEQKKELERIAPSLCAVLLPW